MNISQLQSLVPASFECEAMDENGDFHPNKVGIKLRRLAFRNIARESFQQAMTQADKDPTVIGELLAGKKGQLGLLAEWEIFIDEANTEMLPITVDNIIDQPYDFVANLATAVFNKLFPNPTKAANSGDGSGAAASTTTARTNSGKDGASALRLASGT